MPIGCWADNSYRSLQDNFLQSADMSTEVCESFCKGYPIFGTENGTWSPDEFLALENPGC